MIFPIKDILCLRNQMKEDWIGKKINFRSEGIPKWKFYQAEECDFFPDSYYIDLHIHTIHYKFLCITGTIC